jgi:hypothetical protein
MLTSQGLKLVRVVLGTAKQLVCVAYNCTNFRSQLGIHPNHASTVWRDLLIIVLECWT